MTSTPGVLVDDNVLEVIREAQLDKFTNKFIFVFNVRRFEHFSHVRDKDMQDIGMQHSQIRQLREQILKMSREMWNRSDPKQIYVQIDQSTPAQSSIDENALIPNEQIKMYEMLGEGSFAVVKRGVWMQGSGQKVDVAVKILRDISPNIMEDLRVEASHLLKLEHPSLIRLYGIVRQPAMMVFELCEGGSLLDRLRDDKKPVLLVSRLHEYCIQIAKALQFLESKHCVHRDVAARNILLAEDEKTVKICDFGLMRVLKDNDQMYTMAPQKKVPFAWCSPEVLRHRKFSHASDVWSYGVTIWEVFTFGEEPWVGCRAIDVLKSIDAGEHLEKPKHCSQRIYQIMQKCWKSNPAERIKFSEILKDLKAAMFLEAVAREAFNSIQPGMLQLVKNDKVVVVENTGKDWFGQSTKSREFGFFPITAVTLTNNLATQPFGAPVALQINPPPIPPQVLTRSLKIKLFLMIDIFLESVPDLKQRAEEKKRLYDMITPAPYEKPRKIRKRVLPAEEMDADFTNPNSGENSVEKRSSNLPDNANYYDKNYQLNNEKDGIEHCRYNFEDFDISDLSYTSINNSSLDEYSPESYPQLSILTRSQYIPFTYKVDKRLGDFKFAIVDTGDGYPEYAPLKKLNDHLYQILYVPVQTCPISVQLEAKDGKKWRIFNAESMSRDLCIQSCVFELIGKIGHIEVQVSPEQAGSLSIELHGAGLVTWEETQYIRHGKTLDTFILSNEGRYCIVLRANGFVVGIHRFMFGKPEKHDLEVEKTIQISTSKFLAAQFSFKPKLTDTSYRALDFVYKTCTDGLITISTKKPVFELVYVSWNHVDNIISGGQFDFVDMYESLECQDVFITKKLVLSGMESLNPLYETTSSGDSTGIVMDRHDNGTSVFLRGNENRKRDAPVETIEDIGRSLCERLLRIIPEGSIMESQFKEAIEYGEKVVANMGFMLRALRQPATPFPYRVYNLTLTDDLSDSAKTLCLTRILQKLGFEGDFHSLKITCFGKMACSDNYFIEFTIFTRTSPIMDDLIDKLWKLNCATKTKSSEFIVFSTSKDDLDLARNTLLLKVVDTLSKSEKKKKLWIFDSNVYQSKTLLFTFDEIKVKYGELLKENIQIFKKNIKKKMEEICQ